MNARPAALGAYHGAYILYDSGFFGVGGERDIQDSGVWCGADLDVCVKCRVPCVGL